jgi:hypothetical protein
MNPAKAPFEARDATYRKLAMSPLIDSGRPEGGFPRDRTVSIVLRSDISVVSSFGNSGPAF